MNVAQHQAVNISRILRTRAHQRVMMTETLIDKVIKRVKEIWQAKFDSFI